MRKIIIGALAHVDAGKTSLCEAILYKCNVVRNKGRVDHKDSFLDFNKEERNRGITIFNKEARFSYLDKDYIYVDTPGHDELRNESNKAIEIIDVGLIIISGTDYIPTDTINSFNNLLNKNIPVIIFVNKMDVNYTNKDNIMHELKNKLSENCSNNLLEDTATLSDEYMDKYLNNKLTDKDVSDSIMNNELFPVIFGSALKDDGINELLNTFDKYINLKEIDNNELNAYIYKVTSINNELLTHLKVISGTLVNKTSFGTYKIHEIRQYNGEKYTNINEVQAGDLCSVIGLNELSIGTYIPSLINESSNQVNALTYKISSNIDNELLYKTISPLNNENPELNINIKHNNVYINLNGELQKEIIANLIKDKYDLIVNYSTPIIHYKETILKETLGIGHFEPLRHYAEVIVKIKPINEGITIKSLINDSYTATLVNYLYNHHPKGILTNSYLTNIEIDILDYKVHPKHTQGQDLINALKRAIRYALHNNELIILEPYKVISISVNDETINKVINELNNYSCKYYIEDGSIISKVSDNNFNELILSLKMKLKNELSYTIIENTYDTTSRQEEIINKFNYDYLSDTFNPVGSIFTSKGAGHYVEPSEVINNMHLNINDYLDEENKVSISHNKTKIDEEELQRVWNSLYKKKERTFNKKKEEKEETKQVNVKPLLYLIDGYNLLYSIEELSELSESSFEAARDKVIDIALDFKGLVSAEVIVVFDAYKQDSSKPTILNKENITIIYTKHLQTADAYIEQATASLKNKYKIITVTSDYLEQIRIISNDSLRLSSREFIQRYNNLKKNKLINNNTYTNRPLIDLLKLLEEKD